MNRIMKMVAIGIVLSSTLFMESVKADTYEPPAIQKNDIELDAHCFMDKIGKWKVINHSGQDIKISYKRVGEEQSETKIIKAYSQTILDKTISSKEDKLMINYGEYEKTVGVPTNSCVPFENNKK